MEHYVLSKMNKQTVELVTEFLKVFGEEINKAQILAIVELLNKVYEMGYEAGSQDTYDEMIG